MKIALDIDSTLFPYWDGFAAAARRRFGIDLPYEHQVSWDIPELRPEQVRVVIAETHRDERILAATPYPGALETVRGWHRAGHEIHVASHRDASCEPATARWLAEIGLPYDALSCSWDKVAYCLEVGAHVLIDDSPVNLRRALDEGMTAATIAHPWNADVCAEEDVVRAADWPELGRALAPVLGAVAIG